MRKVNWAQVGKVTEPGRYMFRFGFVIVTADDLAIWEKYPEAAFTLLPMLFVLTITLWALGKLTLSNFTADNVTPIMFINGIASLSLILLAVYLVIKGLLEAKRGKRDATDFLAPEKAGVNA